MQHSDTSRGSDFASTFSRRRVLRLAAGGAAALIAAPSVSGAEGNVDVIQSVEPREILKGQGPAHWFHPRACRVPGSPPLIVMTLQDIHGSDAFGPVHFTESQDAGLTWADPKPIFTMTPPPQEGDNAQEATCDMVPEYHAKTNTVLTIGHTVNYRNNQFFKDQPPRWPVYTVRDANGNWSERRKIAWDDPRGGAIYTCGCAQRVTLENGDLLIPMTFGPSRMGRSVATFKCTFDGKEVLIREVGPEIRPRPAAGKGAGRGLLEPSMTTLDGKYYVTMRAEDGRGYVAVSEDGMNWAPQIPWSWDDGTPLDMSTTQQHWITHSDGLYLVYTRKHESNAGVFRWRTPLFISMVDRSTMRLIRTSERIAVPMLKTTGKPPYGGNFHTANVSADESIITESLMSGSRTTVFATRVRWNKPNRLIS